MLQRGKHGHLVIFAKHEVNIRKIGVLNIYLITLLCELLY